VTVTPFSPDAPLGAPRDLDSPIGEGGAAAAFGPALARALDNAGAALSRADGAERAFIGGHGGLQEMVVERAQADVLLTIAGAAASRSLQTLSTILGMQI